MADGEWTGQAVSGWGRQQVGGAGNEWVGQEVNGWNRGQGVRWICNPSLSKQTHFSPSLMWPECHFALALPFQKCP